MYFVLCLGTMLKKAKKPPRKDADRFINPEAQSKFDETFSKKIPVPERDFFREWDAHTMGEHFEQI